MSERYEGTRYLRLLELYVLKSINELSEEDKASLNEMTPKLEKTYNTTGTWDEIIKNQMKFPDNMPQLIEDMWKKNLEIAKENNVTLKPEEFAMMFVDSNLV